MCDPSTRYPFWWSTAAATDESTPPLIATRTDGSWFEALMGPRLPAGASRSNNERVWSRKALAVAVVVTLALAGCTRTRIVERRVGRLPPIPTTSSQSSTPNEPPLVWAWGTLAEADPDG